MAKRPLPSPEVLRQLLRYEPDTGKLFWLPRGPEWFKAGNTSVEGNCSAWNKRFSDREAIYAVGTLGYYQGTVLMAQVRAHRVAWAITHGAWPTQHIDHINGSRQDNRLSNLREASRSENLQNRGRPSDNKSGVKGVYWNANEKKWHVQISANGKKFSGGYFKNIEDAASAYAVVAARHHGKFARTS